jgi:hypothetical protein
MQKEEYEEILIKMLKFYENKKFTMCFDGEEHIYNIRELQKLVKKY